MGVFKMKFLPLALSAAFLVTSVMPSQAFTTIPVPTPADRSNVSSEAPQMVQYREDDYLLRRGYHRRGGDSYYNGHRGYRERRRGYRQHNGMWFPLAAFATGAIIGGAINNDGPRRYDNERPVRYGGSHVEWCSNRYRSYRAYDNSYQPNSGPRRECNSPY